MKVGEAERKCFFFTVDDDSQMVFTADEGSSKNLLRFIRTLKVLLSTSRPYQAPSFGSSEKLLEISETNKSTESPSLSIKIFL